ncbi:uncharacterized protein LOC133913998 isoform X2 [Phragmites australis]|uniref:uncharacterized protein LOC133913998 isoform X2 n=1 Tax=Phragmites australis TaxID=29695 RepID=UPI002D7961E7|nr:uncharacterized protein LOC133913998 isoform X2 [Phragmites australis]
MMDGEGSEWIKQVHFRDSSSQDVLLTYKRRRQQQTQPEPQPQSQPEHKAEDVPAQQSKDTFWKSRDMGWKYGIMIDENRQHWKCMYCGLTRYGGGVSRLKRHLAGDLDVKMCPKVPANVAEEIREHLRKKRERRRKRAALNGGDNVKTKNSSDDANVKKDLLPADSAVAAGMATYVLEEVTNQTSMVHQDPTSPTVPMLRARDIGWEHAVDLDGNKRRWQCKWCSLCRSGGVTTLKAHLTDDSCPNVPKEISKKVSNFIEEKRATHLLLNTFDFKVDDQVCGTQILGEGIVQSENDQQPSRNATHMETLDKCTINEEKVAAGSNQCGAESSGQPIEHCDQPEEQQTMDHGRTHQAINNKRHIVDKNTENSQNTKVVGGSNQCGADSGPSVEYCDQPEEQWAMDHGRTHQVITTKHQTVDKNAENLENTKILELRRETRFNTRKHKIIVDEIEGHWRCRYCGMDGYGKKFRLQYHLAGAFCHPKCPNVPREVFAKARHHVLTRRRLKINKAGQQFPSGTHIVGKSIDQLQNSSPLCGNHPQLSVNNESIENHPQCQKFPKNAAEKIRAQMISKEQKAGRSGSFDDNGSCDVLCSSNTSQSDQELFTATFHGRSSSQTFDQANSKSKACNTLSNTSLPSQESANPQVCHEQQRKEAATPPEPETGWWHGQRMQWQLQHKPIKEEGPPENGLCCDTDKSEKQSHWSDWWRYVLDKLMHLPDVQEGGGIWTCIRDALLYGCAEFGTVADKVDMDSDGTVNVNIAKCQNVFMDVLRMKNGNYGQAPGLFIHDLKLLWEGLKMAGQDIIHLANSLSSLTEDSYRKLVGRERGSDDSELKGAVVTSSGPKNLVPSTSQGFNQSCPLDVSDVQKDSSCNQCGKEARGGSVLTCNRCMLSCHISCIVPPVPSIPTGSWYLKNCTTNEQVEGDMVLAHYQPNCLHGNCVACDRLDVCSSPKCKDTPNDNSRAIVISSVDSVEDLELPEIDKVGSCKICGDPEDDEKRFLICSHIHCLYKYYHIRCLKSKQIASAIQRHKPCWYCPSCLCRVCLSDKDDDLTILCDGCDEAYHLYCITPRRTSIPKGQWYCSSCSVERAKEGTRQYEKRMLKLHRKDDTRRQSRNFEGVDLLLSAAEQLSADEQQATCTN